MLHNGFTEPYESLNMFRALLCPSLGACDYTDGSSKKIQFEQFIAYTNSCTQDGRRQQKGKEENMIQIPKTERIIIPV